jgi:GT2 family glycosyltransferase
LKPPPKVAIVILNWNGKKFLEQFLPSVISSTYSNHEIIVADNNSSDDSIEFLKTNHPFVKIIQNADNWGFARGYNEALKQVSADYYVLLNSDVEVSGHWLEPMVDLLENDNSIAACQPKILSFHNKKMFEYAGAAGGWIDKYGYPFCKGRVFDKCEEDRGQYDQPAPIFWASGAALFIRSSAFQESGGFDQYFFAHQEEIDLCWRLQLAGHKIYSCPSSIVYHVGAGTLQKGNPKKTVLNFRNNLIMLTKNLPVGRRWIIIARIMLDAVAAWKGLLTGNGGYFMAIFKAHLGFLKWIFTGSKEKLSPRLQYNQLSGVFKGNLIWQFFIKKKKTFAEIVQNP